MYDVEAVIIIHPIVNTDPLYITLSCGIGYFPGIVWGGGIMSSPPVRLRDVLREGHLANWWATNSTYSVSGNSYTVGLCASPSVP